MNAQGVRAFEAMTATQQKTYSSEATHPTPPPQQSHSVGATAGSSGPSYSGSGSTSSGSQHKDYKQISEDKKFDSRMNCYSAGGRNCK
jgi:hypothetical protein